MIRYLRLMWFKWRALRSISKNVSYGKNFSFGKNCRLWAPTRLNIGNNVSLGSNVRIEVDGNLGDCVLIASNVAIVGREDHAIDEVGGPITSATWVGHDPNRLSKPVTIEEDVWIGYGTVILSGVKIGASSIIGAGSVVTRDVDENCIVAGNPARFLRRRFDEASYKKHKKGLLNAKEKPAT
jgi:acetyltransferase-like isoleucine patch superfamily enzyme